MESFHLLEMHFFNIVMYLGLLLATLIAQYGFIVIATDLAKYEKLAGLDKDD
jgi:hypothetical protein